VSQESVGKTAALGLGILGRGKGERFGGHWRHRALKNPHGLLPFEAARCMFPVSRESKWKYRLKPFLCPWEWISTRLGGSSSLQVCEERSEKES